MIHELLAVLDEMEEGMAGRFQAFCPPEEAAVLRNETKLARDVVETARKRSFMPPELKEALKRYDEGMK